MSPFVRAPGARARRSRCTGCVGRGRVFCRGRGSMLRRRRTRRCGGAGGGGLGCCLHPCRGRARRCVTRVGVAAAAGLGCTTTSTSSCRKSIAAICNDQETVYDDDDGDDDDAVAGECAVAVANTRCRRGNTAKMNRRSVRWLANNGRHDNVMHYRRNQNCSLARGDKVRPGRKPKMRSHFFPFIQ